MVVDDNEAPDLMLGGLAISGRNAVDYAENGMGMVATYSAAGPDAAGATWSLSGADAGAFSISSAGVLTFMDSPNYEMPMDANTDNTYMVMVKANDGTNDAMKTVSVRVTNVEDPGRVTFWRDGADVTTAAIVVGDELGGAVDDSDGNPGDTLPIAMYTRIAGANITSWQWAKSMTPDMMGQLDGHHRRDGRCVHGDGRRQRISPAGDGDVHRRGRHREDGFGEDHDGDHERLPHV